MKVCTKCKENKELSKFHKQKSGKNGLQSKCISCKIEESRSWYSNNKIQANLSNKIWIENNRDKYNANERNRWLNNINYRLAKTIRCKLNQTLKSKVHYKKINSGLNLLGCNVDEFKLYLESKFLPEMNWGNQGDVWEIDHIIPCEKFDLSKLEEQQKCFHFSNQQPLFKTTEIAMSFGYTNQIGNRNKSNKLL